MTWRETTEEFRRGRDAAVLALAMSAHRDRLLSWAYDDGDPDQEPEATACWHPEHGDDADSDEWAVVHVGIGEKTLTWTVERDVAEATDLPVGTCCLNGEQRGTAVPQERNGELLDFAGVSQD